MSIEEMAEQIVHAVAFWGDGTSFVDLENEIGEAMKGDLDLFLPGRPNSVIWSDVSLTFAEGFTSAVRSKKIKISLSSLLVYAHDGKIPRLPVAEKLESADFEEARWVPVALSPR